MCKVLVDTKCDRLAFERVPVFQGNNAHCRTTMKFPFSCFSQEVALAHS